MFKFFKKENPLNLVIDEQQNYILILNQLIQCLETSDNHPQARVVERLKEFICEKNVAEFVKLIKGVDMWGGAGAVWEVYIEDPTLAWKFESTIIQLID